MRGSFLNSLAIALWTTGTLSPTRKIHLLTPHHDPAALASPLTEFTNTAVSIDSDSSLVSSGSLLVHVVRTDDLRMLSPLLLRIKLRDSAVSDFTPSHERSLILERLTHLVLRIQLDEDSGSLLVNDQAINLSAVREAKGLQVVKAQVCPLLADCCGNVVLTLSLSQALVIPNEEMMVEGKLLSKKEILALAEKTLPVGLVGVRRLRFLLWAAR